MCIRDNCTTVLWLLVFANVVSAQRVSVRDFGAIGDDQADDTAAFTKALEAGRNVYVPAGIYRIKSIALPEGTYLHGDGLASVIRFQHEKIGNFAVDLKSSCRISNLRFTATEPFVDWMHATGESTSAMLRMQAAKKIELDHVQIDDYRRMGIAEIDQHERAVVLQHDVFEFQVEVYVPMAMDCLYELHNIE